MEDSTKSIYTINPVIMEIQKHDCQKGTQGIHIKVGVLV